jgi:hypothetical protein
VPVTNLPGHEQFFFEDTGRTLVALRRGNEQLAFRCLVEAAADLPQNFGGVGVAAQQMQFVQQHENQDGAGQDVHVERLDLHFRLVKQILYRFQMVARPKPAFEIGRLLDHPDGLLVSAIRNRLRRAHEQCLCPRPLVHQHDRQHQAGAVGRFR